VLTQIQAAATYLDKRAPSSIAPVGVDRADGRSRSIIIG